MAPGTRLPLLAVLFVAAAMRLTSHVETAGGPLPYLHRWTQSDMCFYDTWARGIAGGDLLARTTPRPYHGIHDHLAREAHARSGSPEPFDEAVGRRIWRVWLGDGTFYQDPLYPYVVGGIYAVAGPRPRAVFLVQALLGLATVALVYALARRLFGDRVAVVAGFLAALYGPLVLYEGLLLRESMITCAGLATLAAFIAAAEQPRHRRWTLLAGFASGVSLLLKSTSLAFTTAAAAVLTYRWGRQAPRGLAWLAAGFLLATAPLVARNVAVGLPPFSVVSGTMLSYIFIGGNAEDVDPGGGTANSSHMVDILERTDGDWLAMIVETLHTHRTFWGWPRLLGAKLLAFWGWYEIPDNADYYYYRLQAPVASAVAVEWTVLAPFAVTGLVLGAGRSAPYLLAALYVAAGVATNVIFFTISRYRLPVALALAPFAALALVEIVRAPRARRWLRTAALVTTTMAAAVVVLRPPPRDRTIPRVADFGVANEIAGHLARQAASEGRGDDARRLVERQMATEPLELRAADPRAGQTRLSLMAGALAGSFAPLHELAAELDGARGDLAAKEAELRRAWVLRRIAERYDAVKQGAAPAGSLSGE